MMRCTLRLLLAGLCVAVLAAPCAPAQTAGDDPKTKAKEAIGKKDYDKAIELLSALLQTKQDDPDAYFLRGLGYFQKGDFDKAIADLDEAVGIDPNFFGYFRLRGRAYAAKREYAKALSNFDYAIELAPKEASSYLDRGFIHTFRKEYDKAMADYNECIRLQPKAPQGYYWRGSVYAMREQNKKALADFDKALALAPKFVQARIGRGSAFLRLKDYGKAKEDFVAAVKETPDDANACNNLAWLLATSPDAGVRDGKQAVEYATKACTITKHRNAADLDTLAAAYAEIGDFRAAVRWQERALRMLPAEPALQVQDYRARLKLYQEGKPYRLP